MSKREYPSQKQHILESAEALVLEQGLGSLKTDALIKATGLSKGGFFYHFKTLDDLLFELGRKISNEFYSEVIRLAEADKNPIGRFSRAYIEICLGRNRAQQKKGMALCRVHMEIVLANPKIMEKVKKGAQKDFKMFDLELLEDQLPIPQLRMIQMAVDGVSFNESMGTTSITTKERNDLRDYLLSLTKKKI